MNKSPRVETKILIPIPARPFVRPPSALCNPVVLEACGFSEADKERFDGLTKKYTAFASFDALVHAEPSYRPTLPTAVVPELHELADGYDKYQDARGDTRRAFRTERKQ